ncbi:DUF7575 domain-containing protein [Natrialba aegyptia]|uniref:DUF7575 domain-containing protein n=1 Tax=Natrialba aegyptia DSM 13077 TaxID=1227491 RepID=M0BA48_9EURY|nr:hypothetical protein [Natrialba aegyptia]ELZ07700.1 hypothetical protein C480_06591 [Natrialba aegyptia DSM 13077]
MTWLRALVIGGLSLLVPGAGHALLRDWLRAFAFGGLFIAAGLFFLPTAEIAAADSFADSMTIATQETERITQFLFSFIALFAAIDATFRALGVPPGRGSNDADGPTCPTCGKELDEDLSFCHWCTTRLESPPASEGETAGAVNATDESRNH